MARSNDRGRRTRRRRSDGDSARRGPKDARREDQRQHSSQASVSRPARDTEGQMFKRGRANARELRHLLEGIGAPLPAPFKPDPFQLEALAALEYEDVLVT